MNKYYYISKDKVTGELKDLHLYNIDKTQSEMDDLLEKFNTSNVIDRQQEQVTDKKTMEIIDFAMKWKSSKTLEDIIDSLDDIRDNVDRALYDVTEHIDGLKKTINSTRNSEEVEK